MEKPKIPVDIVVVVNGQVWDDRIKGTYKCCVGDKINIEAYLVDLVPTSSIDKILEWIDTPLIEIYMDDKLLTKDRSPWRAEFVVTEEWFKPPKTYKEFKFIHPGNCRAIVSGWKVYGIYPFLISLPGQKYQTTTHSAMKVVSFSKKIE